jgi:protein-S-isoprenylcysteine O-methyltransferase Ste14
VPLAEAIIRLAVAVLWVAWLIYWGSSARDVKPTRRTEPLKSQLLHRIPLILGIICLAAPRWMPHGLTRRVLPRGIGFLLLGAVLVAAGLAFAVWARRHLGRNWSSHVVLKQDHALVRSGPYQRVRHPIYTGILLALLGTAITIGELRAAVGFALFVVSFVLKSRTEERWMREVFPEYEQYRQGTAALIPKVY